MYLLARFLFSLSTDIAVMSKSINTRLALVLSIFNEFRMLIFSSLYLPYIAGGGDRSTQRKPPPYPKSLATFSHAPVDFLKHANLLWKCVSLDLNIVTSWHYGISLHINDEGFDQKYTLQSDTFDTFKKCFLNNEYREYLICLTCHAV